MSNHHLRNKELTLKAKGLLSQMLSLPENWDYTLAGLSHINKESIDAIRTAVLDIFKSFFQRAFNRLNLCNRHISFKAPLISSISSGYTFPVAFALFAI